MIKFKIKVNEAEQMSDINGMGNIWALYSHNSHGETASLVCITRTDYVLWTMIVWADTNCLPFRKTASQAQRQGKVFW